MEHETKDDLVTELMRLVEAYGVALLGDDIGMEIAGIDAVEACARKLVGAREPLPPTEQPCFRICNGDISLQSVAGGVHPTGLYGTVWLRIGDQVVEYVRKSSSLAVVSGGAKP